jgi:hypothetical protein
MTQQNNSKIYVIWKQQKNENLLKLSLKSGIICHNISFKQMHRFKGKSTYESVIIIFFTNYYNKKTKSHILYNII